MLAWATRHRLTDAEKVAQWWEQIEEPQRDLYISNLTSEGFWPQVARFIAIAGAANRTGVPGRFRQGRPLEAISPYVCTPRRSPIRSPTSGSCTRRATRWRPWRWRGPAAI